MEAKGSFRKISRKKPENNPETIKKLLVEQISSTVRWRESIIYMSDIGIKNYI